MEMVNWYTDGDEPLDCLHAGTFPCFLCQVIPFQISHYRLFLLKLEDKEINKAAIFQLTSVRCCNNLTPPSQTHAAISSFILLHISLFCPASWITGSKKEKVQLRTETQRKLNCRHIYIYMYSSSGSKCPRRVSDCVECLTLKMKVLRLRFIERSETIY